MIFNCSYYVNILFYLILSYFWFSQALQTDRITSTEIISPGKFFFMNWMSHQLLEISLHSVYDTFEIIILYFVVIHLLIVWTREISRSYKNKIQFNFWLQFLCILLSLFSSFSHLSFHIVIVACASYHSPLFWDIFHFFFLLFFFSFFLFFSFSFLIFYLFCFSFLFLFLLLLFFLL